MFRSAMIGFLLLLPLQCIVQATATTCTVQQECTQRGTSGCRWNLVNATCNRLRESGLPTSMSCSPPPLCMSCRDIHLSNPSAPSGNYQIELSNGTVVNVYCDMEGTNCNGQGGWTRVAFVNMSQPGASCPPGLTQIELSNLTLCSREDNARVQSTSFSTLGLSYSSVCGRVRAYQYGRTDGFYDSIDEPESIDFDRGDQAYVSGVSITHGTRPRQHIWTYAVGFQEDGTTIANCPCNNGTDADPPSFVGQNYYCESGSSSNPVNSVLYLDDPLWDGVDCNNLETTCCTNRSLPWFSTTLPQSTTEYIELRIMFFNLRRFSGGPLDLIELYIR